jgi:hypothetical protein
MAEHGAEAQTLRIYRAGTIILYAADGKATDKIEQSLSANEFMAKLGHPVKPGEGEADSQAGGAKPAPTSAVPAGALLIDDFEGSDHEVNRFGGMWSYYTAASRDSLSTAILAESNGNHALEIRGQLKEDPERKLTYGGLYTYLMPGKATTMDLSKFKTMQFRARTNASYPTYMVRIDLATTDSLGLARAAFTVTSEWDTFSIPMADFTSGAAEANMITWELPPLKDMDVSLIVDDIMFIK